MSDTRPPLDVEPVLRLTGEQIGSITPPPEGDWFVDWDEYEEFVPKRLLEAALAAAYQLTGPDDLAGLEAALENDIRELRGSNPGELAERLIRRGWRRGVTLTGVRSSEVDAWTTGNDNGANAAFLTPRSSEVDGLREAAQEIIDWHDERFPWPALWPRIARLRAALTGDTGPKVEPPCPDDCRWRGVEHTHRYGEATSGLIVYERVPDTGPKVEPEP